MTLTNRNHTYQDISLNLGETWTIVGTFNVDGSPLVTDSSTLVCFKLADIKSLVLNIKLTSSVAITDSVQSSYRIVIQPSQQINTPNLRPGLYRYELSVVLSNGTTIIQAEGACSIIASLSYQFKTAT